MPKSKNFLLTILVAGFIVPVSAQAAGDAVAHRQAMMKQNGAATRVLAGMVKGQTPFNANAAQLAFRTLNSVALGFGYMFPAGSQANADTKAAPAIWSDRVGFNAAVAKYVTDTSVTITDMDGLKAAFGAATSNCGSCHKAYRTK